LMARSSIARMQPFSIFSSYFLPVRLSVMERVSLAMPLSLTAFRLFQRKRVEAALVKRRLVTALLILAAIVGFAVARRALGTSFSPKALADQLRLAGSAASAFPIFAGLYAAGTALLLPSTVLNVAAGAMWGVWGGFARCMLVANLLGHAHFFLGRWVGRERLRALLVRRGWTRAIGELERSGIVTVLVLRQVPIPFVATNMVCGASPMTWPQFLVGHFVGLVPGLLVWNSFAAAVVDGVEGASDRALTGALLAGGSMAVLAISTRLLLGVVARRRALADQRTTPT